MNEQILLDKAENNLIFELIHVFLRNGIKEMVCSDNDRKKKGED